MIAYVFLNFTSFQQRDELSPQLLPSSNKPPKSLHSRPLHPSLSECHIYMGFTFAFSHKPCPAMSLVTLVNSTLPLMGLMSHVCLKLTSPPFAHVKTQLMTLYLFCPYDIRQMGAAGMVRDGAASLRSNQ